eukprot:scaffold9389_cov124-Skeletonema_marinoi.AAC.4
MTLKGLQQSNITRMHDLFRELNDDLYDIGINWEELGTHSVRKGVGSMVANASTVGPPIVALCLRAGWKLGGVKEMYLFRQDAGDLNVGRRAACLDIETKEFGISPPYCDCSDLDEDGKLAVMNKVERWMKERIPKVDSIPANSWNLAVQRRKISLHLPPVNQSVHQSSQWSTASYGRMSTANAFNNPRNKKEIAKRLLAENNNLV